MSSPAASADSHRPSAGTPITLPTSAHVLMCTGPTCSQRGARANFAAVWRALEDERLAYYSRGGSVRFTEAGCLGACEEGPTVVAYIRSGEEPSVLIERAFVRMDAAATLEVARAAHEGALD